MILFDEEMEDIRLYDLAEVEEQAVEACGGDSTYGELSYELLEWALAEADPHADDVICDLGSGGGRALLYLALRSGCRAVGVELAPSRHCSAVALLDLAAPFLVPGQVVLHQGDMTDPDGPQKSATVVFLANKLFGEDFTERALQSVEEPRCLVTLRPVPSWVEKLKCTALLPTSWSRSQPVWLYADSQH